LVKPLRREPRDRYALSMDESTQSHETPSDPTRSEGQTATIEPARAAKPAPAPPKLDRLPPYRVLLHNDDHSDMLDVVEAIVDITPLKYEQAIEIMLRAHTRGLALVLVTHKERAELYQDQFRTKKLVATIEPAE
jgi:ATP-dependent Clp protease adaptor protein ClpS